MLAFAQILKVTAFAILAALLFLPYLSVLHTVMLGVALFWMALRRIS